MAPPHFELRFTPRADAELAHLEKTPNLAKRLKAVQSGLGKLQANTRHQGLHTHKFESLSGPNGEEVFTAYAQNETPGAYRVFFRYGPNVTAGEGKKKKVVTHVLTIVAITPHP